MAGAAPSPAMADIGPAVTTGKSELYALARGVRDAAAVAAAVLVESGDVARAQRELARARALLGPGDAA